MQSRGPGSWGHRGSPLSEGPVSGHHQRPWLAWCFHGVASVPPWFPTSLSGADSWLTQENPDLSSDPTSLKGAYLGGCEAWLEDEIFFSFFVFFFCFVTVAICSSGFSRAFRKVCFLRLSVWESGHVPCGSSGGIGGDAVT